MILFQNERVGCEQCIRGHRAADCIHLNKPLITIKGRGRPGNKDESLRLRIAPNPPVSHESDEPIEPKNGRGKCGTMKKCFHLEENTEWEYYKVKLGKGFKVLGPATQQEIANSAQNSQFKVQVNNRQRDSSSEQAQKQKKRKRSLTNSPVDTLFTSGMNSSPANSTLFSPVFGRNQQKSQMIRTSSSSLSPHSLEDQAEISRFSSFQHQTPYSNNLIQYQHQQPQLPTFGQRYQLSQDETEIKTKTETVHIQCAARFRNSTPNRDSMSSVESAATDHPPGLIPSYFDASENGSAASLLNSSFIQYTADDFIGNGMLQTSTGTDGCIDPVHLDVNVNPSVYDDMGVGGNNLGWEELFQEFGVSHYNNHSHHL